MLIKVNNDTCEMVDAYRTKIIVWALKMWKRGKGWGKNLVCRKYTPFYKNGIKKIKNKSMETTSSNMCPTF